MYICIFALTWKKCGCYYSPFFVFSFSWTLINFFFTFLFFPSFTRFIPQPLLCICSAHIRIIIYDSIYNMKYVNLNKFQAHTYVIPLCYHNLWFIISIWYYLYIHIWYGMICHVVPSIQICMRAFKEGWAIEEKWNIVDMVNVIRMMCLSFAVSVWWYKRGLGDVSIHGKIKYIREYLFLISIPYIIWQNWNKSGEMEYNWMEGILFIQRNCKMCWGTPQIHNAWNTRQ